MKMDELIHKEITMKKSILFTSACLIGSCAALVYADDATNGAGTRAATVVGSYLCSGTNFVNNEKYDSKLNITQTGQTYQFTWTSSDGKYKGTGFTGENPSQLMVAFKKMNDASFTGAQLYTISQDGATFKGRWVLIGKNMIGSETCQKTT